MSFMPLMVEMFKAYDAPRMRVKRANHPLECVYNGMLRRCYTPTEANYHRYGGRGIEVCERWRERYAFGFSNFVHDMGPRPKGHSLDRIDNNGNYCPENCRWSNRTTQNRNREWSRYVMVDGVKTPIAEVAKLSKRPLTTVAARLKRGWTIEEAISDKTYQGLRKKEKRGS